MIITTMTTLENAINNAKLVMIRSFCGDRFVRISKSEARTFLAGWQFEGPLGVYDGDVLKIGALA